MRRVGVLLASMFATGFAVGCNQLFDIDDTDVTESPDADPDDDGVPNTSDNCVAIENPTQADEESDGIGDRCDNCPLVENVLQVDTDLDGTGDLCDAHPATLVTTADNGVHCGLSPNQGFEPPAIGGAGIRVREDTFEISAIALYQFQATPCAAPIIR